MTRIHAARALVDGVEVTDLAIEVDAAGQIAALTAGTSAEEGDLRLDAVLPGSGNAHSHAFHRALRGRTHDGIDGTAGDFWRWRTVMYDVASRLTPDSYQRLAEAVFAEMLVAGWTSVAEFHYVHHQPDGTPYPDADGGPNAFGLALIRAATTVGIRLTLLDTLYLASGPGQPLLPEQARFGDASVEAWLERWGALRDSSARKTGFVGAQDGIRQGRRRDSARVGAAIHSVRAVSPEDIARVGERLPAEVPLHIHLSEQVAENEQSLAAYGRTPTGVLAEAGLLSPRLSVVHATHLTDDDIALLGGAQVNAVFCPTTEADLGDGIGPARELVDAGAVLSLGSDQNAVVDPWLEVRGLEAGERLRSQQRGRFRPTELEHTRSVGGYAAAGLVGGIAVGAAADLVEIDTDSVRTAGAAHDQLALTCTASDVRRVIVGGRVVADGGLLADGRNPAAMLSSVLREFTP